MHSIYLEKIAEGIDAFAPSTYKLRSISVGHIEVAKQYNFVTTDDLPYKPPGTLVAYKVRTVTPTWVELVASTLPAASVLYIVLQPTQVSKDLLSPAATPQRTISLIQYPLQPKNLTPSPYGFSTCPLPESGSRVATVLRLEAASKDGRYPATWTLESARSPIRIGDTLINNAPLDSSPFLAHATIVGIHAFERHWTTVYAYRNTPEPGQPAWILVNIRNDMVVVNKEIRQLQEEAAYLLPDSTPFFLTMRLFAKRSLPFPRRPEC